MAVETVRVEGLDDVLRRLKALGAEASKRGGPVRAGVRAGAMVIVKEAQVNVQRVIDTPNKGGMPTKSTGLLKKSIKTFRAKAKAGERGETFIVTVKRNSKYSDERIKGKLKTARVVGQRLEYDTSKMQPHPWMRPAFHAKKQEAVKVMKEKTLAGIDKLEKKLSKT